MNWPLKNDTGFVTEIDTKMDVAGGESLGQQRAKTFQTTRRMKEKERAEKALYAIQETKGEDILLFDMENRSSITDYVLICTGRSQAHVRGIADRIEQAFRLDGVRPLTVEGHQEGSWILMDYDVLLVHVFHPETRAFYDLEELLESFPSQRFSGDAEDTGGTTTIGGAPNTASSTLPPAEGTPTVA